MALRYRENVARSTNGRKLTLIPLIGVTYCMVAGGPFGLEDLVRMAGYHYAILILMVTPLVWSLPVALMVSELASTFPENGGYYVWVKRGLGPFWGFQEVWLSLAASIFDMAIYPTLFVFYLSRLWPAAKAGFSGIAIGLGVIAVCVVFNVLGTKTVGGSSVLMTALLLSPFAVIGACALFKPAVPVATAHLDHFDLLGGILVAMWNYMGWDNTLTIAGEVSRPQRTYPLAMLSAVVLVALTYVIPIALVSRAGIASGTWETGSWVDIAATIAGRGIAVAVMIGGMISSLSMFNALVLSYSRLPVALAEDGFLPKIFARKHRKTQAPWFSILVCASAWAACLGFGFVRLLILDALLYGLSLLLEFAALVALRIKEPDLPRPYRVPGGLFGAVLVGAISLPIIGIALVRSMSNEGGAISGFALGCSLIAMGIGVYVAGAFNRKRRQLAPGD